MEIPARILEAAKKPCPVCRHRHKEYTEIIDTKIVRCEPAGYMVNCLYCQHVDFYCDAAITKRFNMDNHDGLKLGRTIKIDPHFPERYHYMTDKQIMHMPPRQKGMIPYENINPTELAFKVTIDESTEHRYH